MKRQGLNPKQWGPHGPRSRSQDLALVSQAVALVGPVLWKNRLSIVSAANLFFAHSLAARCSGRCFLPS